MAQHQLLAVWRSSRKISFVFSTELERYLLIRFLPPLSLSLSFYSALLARDDASLPPGRWGLGQKEI